MVALRSRVVPCSRTAPRSKSNVGVNCLAFVLHVLKLDGICRLQVRGVLPLPRNKPPNYVAGEILQHLDRVAVR